MDKKIYYINALSAKLGGGKTYIINLLRHLPKNVIIYVSCPVESLLPIDSRVVYIKSDFANKNLLFRAVWENISLRILLSKFNVDVLFVPGGADFMIGGVSIPKVTMFRNMLPFDATALGALSTLRSRLKNFLLKKIMLKTMRGAQHVIFISEYAKTIVQNITNLPSSSVIYHGIPRNFFPVTVSEKNKEKINQEYILYVSRFEPYKNHLNVIKAYSRLPEVLKNRYKLVLVGEFMNPSYAECVDYIEKENLKYLVDIKGKVSYEKLPELYQQAALFVFASSCENCPNILLEAIGCGAPILSSKTKPMPEFARDTAMYFDESDDISIYRAIMAFFASSSAESKMRAKSVELSKVYTWENTAALTWRCLELVGEKYV